jgi:hypothetical protein
VVGREEAGDVSNERLRDALNRTGHSYESLGEAIGVDPKSIQRWVIHDRVPHGRNRHAAAKELGESDAWLWPTAASSVRSDEAARSELVQLYPRRSAMAADTWDRLFSNATTFIDILVYAGLFLPEQMPAAIEMIKSKASEGVRVRLLLGEPNSAAVALRGIEENIGDAVAIKVRNALSLLKRPLSKAPNVTVRLHGTTLYTSTYRVDDEMIVNPHVIGLPAAQAPALHLRRVAVGGLFDTYAAAYDRVWDDAKPAWT